MNRLQTFGKHERLKRRKAIGALFSGGHKCQAFPLRVLFVPVPAGQGLRAGVTVSSRYFKRAVDRNRVKRLLREGWRTVKAELCQRLQTEGRGLHLFFIYTGTEVPDYTLIREKMNRILQQLNQWLDENPAAAA
jgi:ribonuclease P protein component